MAINLDRYLLATATREDVRLTSEIAEAWTDLSSSVDGELLVCEAPGGRRLSVIARTREEGPVVGFVEVVTRGPESELEVWLRSPERHLIDMAMWLVTMLATPPHTASVTQKRTGGAGERTLALDLVGSSLLARSELGMRSLSMSRLLDDLQDQLLQLLN